VPARSWTLGPYLDYWLENVVRPARRPATFALYEMTVRVHISPTLGKYPLKRLSVPIVQELGEVAAERQLGQRVVKEDLHGIEGEHRQVLLLEQTRQLSADPAVLYRVGVRPDDGSCCFLVGMIDYQGVPVDIEDDDPPAFAGYPGHLRERPPAAGRCSRSRAARHTSNVASGNGSACTCPTSKVMGSWRSLARCRASAIMTSLASSPTRRPAGPTTSARSNTSVPGPHPTSMTACPGTRAIRSSMSRLLAWIPGGFAPHP
jgi:Phage integrase, N-terminal SAM-like domain